LETHAFTAVKHRSILQSPPYSKQSFFSEGAISKIYNPEIISLVKSVTGAKDVLIITNSLLSKEVVPRAKDAKVPPVANVSGWDMKKPMISGLGDQNSRLTPLRSVHIDYTPESARIMSRNFNPEVWEAAKDIIEAEDDAAASGAEYKGRRYAFLSV
jgi:GA4 desaturase